MAVNSKGFQKGKEKDLFGWSDQESHQRLGRKSKVLLGRGDRSVSAKYGVSNGKTTEVLSNG